MLDLLSRLVDKSLVVVDEQPDGTARYRLLETLRQYAREKLAADGEAGATAVRDRHLAWCRPLAEQAAPELHGPRLVAAWPAGAEALHGHRMAAAAR